MQLFLEYTYCLRGTIEQMSKIEISKELMDEIIDTLTWFKYYAQRKADYFPENKAVALLKKLPEKSNEENEDLN